MEAQIDKFGRLVIPKTVRDHLGLREGSIVHIEESDHQIILKLIDMTSQIKFEDGIAVYTGRAIGDLDTAIQQDRDERLKKITEW